MTEIRQRLADALVQAAMEGDDSPKVTVSMRVLEIIVGGVDSLSYVVDCTRPTPFIPAPAAPAGQVYASVQGEALREALRAPLRSQSALARRLGVHSTAINKVCSGVRDISASEAETIRAYLAETEIPEDTTGSRLRFARRATGISTGELAKRVQLSESAVRNQENSTNGIPAALAPKYARELGVTPEWLLYGRGGSPTPSDSPAPPPARPG